MTDKFTLTLTYNRQEILDWAEKGKARGGDLLQIRSFLDQMYPAWSIDVRTSCMVELMFRDESDYLFQIFTEKLAELTPKKDDACSFDWKPSDMH